MTVHLGGIEPIIQKVDGQLIIESPLELAGRTVVTVEAAQCRRRFDVGLRVVCGLVQGHRGPCWVCAEELADSLDGAIAVVTEWSA